MLLASDFDGTLCFHAKEYRDKDLEAIRRFQRAGNLFAICTGRCYAHVMKAFRDAGRFDIPYDYLICTSGACILDNKGNVLMHRPMSFFDAKELYENYSSVLLEKGTVHGLTTIEFFHPRGGTVCLDEHASFDELEGMVVNGVSLCFPFGDNANGSLYADKVDQSGLDVTAFRNRNCVDIVAKGVSKASGLTDLKRICKVERTAGIGDSTNDLPLLRQADVSFTFPSSEDEVKAGADYIVGSIEEAIGILMKEA